MSQLMNFNHWEQSFSQGKTHFFVRFACQIRNSQIRKKRMERIGDDDGNVTTIEIGLDVEYRWIFIFRLIFFEPKRNKYSLLALHEKMDSNFGSKWKCGFIFDYSYDIFDRKRITSLQIVTVSTFEFLQLLSHKIFVWIKIRSGDSIVCSNW